MVFLMDPSRDADLASQMAAAMVCLMVEVMIDVMVAQMAVGMASLMEAQLATLTDELMVVLTEDEVAGVMAD